MAQLVLDTIPIQQQAIDLPRWFNKSKPSFSPVCKEIHTATLSFKLRSLISKVGEEKLKVKCGIAPSSKSLQKSNVVSLPYSKSKCTCLVLNLGPSACKPRVLTSTLLVIDIILIQRQAIHLPRWLNPC